MNVLFPPLRPVSRSREYRSIQPEIRDKIVYQYLFNGLSHRVLDEKVVGHNPDYTRGWVSMGVLHYLGLFDEHKAFFQGYELLDAITILRNQDTYAFRSIILALIRYQDGLYLDDCFEMFECNQEIPCLIKNVGSSQYTDGVRIDKEFHEIFNPSNSICYTPRGSARPIKVLFNNKVFDAEYRYEGQTDTSIILQSIRFKKELKSEFKRVFPEPIGQFTIYMGKDVNHFTFSHSASVLDEEEFDEIEYPEGKLAYRLHRIRERRPEVIKAAKEIFKARYGKIFCEACGFDFQEAYGIRGENFIEGHHTKLVSEMNDNDKTKVTDIVLLCSNCHRMIHKRPIITVDQLRSLIDEKKYNRSVDDRENSRNK